MICPSYSTHHHSHNRVVGDGAGVTEIVSSDGVDTWRWLVLLRTTFKELNAWVVGVLVGEELDGKLEQDIRERRTETNCKVTTKPRKTVTFKDLCMTITSAPTCSMEFVIQFFAKSMQRPRIFWASAIFSRAPTSVVFCGRTTRGVLTPSCINCNHSNVRLKKNLRILFFYNT